jgi:hypothetical protein
MKVFISIKNLDVFEGVGEGVELVGSQRYLGNPDVDVVLLIFLSVAVVEEEDPQRYLHENSKVGKHDNELEVPLLVAGIHALLGRTPVVSRIHEQPNGVQNFADNEERQR